MGAARAISDTVKASTLKPVLRESNIELLRIFAMIGIVMSHLAFSGPGGSSIIQAHNFQTLYITILQGAGQIGVFIFFLITGYFMVNKPFKLDGIKKILSTTWFYSTTFFIFAIIIGALNLNAIIYLDPAKSTLSIQNLIVNLMPVLQNNYWFINAYIVILFLAPSLNQLINSTKQDKLLLILLFVSLGFYALNFVSRSNQWGLTFEIYNNLLLYSLVYSIGAYLRLHPPKLQTSTLLLLITGVTFMYFIWRYYLVFVLQTGDLANKDTDFPPFLLSILAFLLFTRIKIGQINWINTVSASTLAVYIIHTNTNIWQTIWGFFNLYDVFGTAWFYIYPFTIATLVFIICVAIEMGRKLFIEKIWVKIDKAIPQS